MKGIVNRRASKKVTSYFRDNRAMNNRIRAKTVTRNNDKKGAINYAEQNHTDGQAH